MTQSRYEAEVARVWAAQPADGAHDLGHLRRVWKTARLIAMDVPADPQVLMAACFFHDLVNLPKDAPNRAEASTLSAQAAVAFLRGDGFPVAKLGAVAHAIAAHSFSAGIAPETPEARILQDADRLEALFPGRIDLGLGRAPGGDQRTARAVAGGMPAGDRFPEQVQELAGLLSGSLPAAHPYSELLLQPQVPSRPELWMLGSSDFGAQLAAQLGIRFCFAHFINADHGQQLMQMYRQHFQAGYEARPYSAVALFVICADTEAEAADLSAAVDLRRLYQAYGLNKPIPSVVTARAMDYSPRDLAIIASERGRSIVGTPEQVVERMLSIQEACAADEIVVLTVAASYAARLRSTRLLAEAFG